MRAAEVSGSGGRGGRYSCIYPKSVGIAVRAQGGDSSRKAKEAASPIHGARCARQLRPRIPSHALGK
jgi:hypothetical protein